MTPLTQLLPPDMESTAVKTRVSGLTVAKAAQLIDVDNLYNAIHEIHRRVFTEFQAKRAEKPCGT